MLASLKVLPTIRDWKRYSWYVGRYGREAGNLDFLRNLFGNQLEEFHAIDPASCESDDAFGGTFYLVASAADYTTKPVAIIAPPVPGARTRSWPGTWRRGFLKLERGATSERR
jgi:hypothetical protein